MKTTLNRKVKNIRALPKCPKLLRYEKKVKHVQLQFWMLSPLRYVNWWLNAPHNTYITLNVNDA